MVVWVVYPSLTHVEHGFITNMVGHVLDMFLVVSFFIFLILLDTMFVCWSWDFSVLACGGVVKPLEYFFLMNLRRISSSSIASCLVQTLFLIDFPSFSLASSPASSLSWTLHPAQKQSLCPISSALSPPPGSNEAYAPTEHSHSPRAPHLWPGGCCTLSGPPPKCPYAVVKASSSTAFHTEHLDAIVHYCCVKLLP